MPYLTNLADIARSTGLKVIEQPGWKTRGHGAQTGVKTIVCHHTAGSATGNAPSLNVVQDGRSDLPGPLSHFVLGRDGTVFVIAAGQCWHTGATWQTAQSNAYAIGIEAEATGTSAWPEVQMDAYARLCRALCRAFDLGVDRVQGHKEICSPTGRKTDPNFDMAAFRSRVASNNPIPTLEELMKLAEPRDLPAAPDWQRKVFAVEVGKAAEGGNSTVVDDMWLWLVSADFGDSTGSTEYRVWAGNDAGAYIGFGAGSDAPDGTGAASLKGNDTAQFVLKPGTRILTLEWKNNGKAQAGYSFPQVGQ